MTNIIKGKL